MSDGREKPVDLDDANRVATIDSMEKGTDADLDQELGSLDDDEQGANEDADETLSVKEDGQAAMRARYAVDGQPNWFDYREHLSVSAVENKMTREENDWYLRDLQPNDFFAASIGAPAKKYDNYAVKSAFDKSTMTYDPYVEEHRSLHAKTEGTKGLPLYPNPIVYTTAGMCFPLNSDANFVYREGYGRVSLGELARRKDEGVKILTPAGDYATITGYTDSGLQQVYSVKLDNGEAIYLTMNHVLLAEPKPEWATDGYPEGMDASKVDAVGSMSTIELPLAQIIEHGLYLVGPKVTVGEDVTQPILGNDGDLAYVRTRIIRHDPYGEPIPCFDIEIDTAEHLFIVNNVVAHNSEILNFNITAGCSASCSFCKESFLARPYSQIDIHEDSAIIQIDFDGNLLHTPAKAKVKYFDPNVQEMIAGPIVVPISQGWPIETYSLNRLANRESFRVLED